MTIEIKLRKQLTAILQNESESIRKYVAQEALDYYSVEIFFKDILSNGCASGMIGSLIYYTQTHAFFDRFYDDIEEIRHYYKENMGIPLDLPNDLKNTLAWFAFEETAYQLAKELGLSV